MVQQILLQQITVQIVPADFRPKSSVRCDPHIKQT
jgi:hypothetical protein